MCIRDRPCTYPLFERVKLEIEGQSGVIDDVAYGADVVLSISLPAEKAEALQARLTELSAGSITIRVLSEEYRPGPVSYTHLLYFFHTNSTVKL